MLVADSYYRRSGGRSRHGVRAPRPAFCVWEGGTPELAGRKAAASGRLLDAEFGSGSEGYGHNREQVNALITASGYSFQNPYELKMLPLERRGSSNNSCGTSSKMLIDQEISKYMQPERRSPCVVATPMGLHTLPDKHAKYVNFGHSLLKQSHEGFTEENFLYDSETHFKDAFEVKLAESMGPRKWLVQTGLSKSRRRCKKMDYLRQKFVGVKQLSKDEKFENLKQFSEPSGMLKSNEDIFLKLFQEPSSLFIKHLEEYWTTSASSEASHIMILKSCEVNEYENNDMSWRSIRKKERTRLRKSIVDKCDGDLLTHCFGENIAPSEKLSKKNIHENKQSGCLPSHIVLKTSLEFIQENGWPEELQSGYPGHRRCRELRSELRQKQASCNVNTQRTQNSREILKHMVHTVPNGYAKSCTSQRSGYSRSKHSLVPRVSTFMDFGTANGSSCNFVKSHSSSYSAETTTNRKARKHISERWKVVHKFLGGKAAEKGTSTSTLGEMLALFGREMENLQRSAHTITCGKKLLARCRSLPDVSRHNGKKDECPISLHMSRSHSAPSFNCSGKNLSNNCHNGPMSMNVMNLGSRKSSLNTISDERFGCSLGNAATSSNSSQHFNHVLEENNCQIPEFNVEGTCQRGLNMKNFYDKATLTDSKAYDRCNESHLVDCLPDICSDAAELRCLTDDEKLSCSNAPNAPIDDDLICKRKEASKKTLSKELPIDLIPCAVDQACSLSVAGHPSSVSVLESPDKHKYSPECSRRVNVDVREPRPQTQPVNPDSMDVKTETSVALGSSEDADGSSNNVLEAGGNPKAFQGKGGLEFTYLLDILTQSGFHDGNWDFLYHACYFSEYPIASDVFDKVEETYSQLTWSRTERKLLFDLINSTMGGILAQNMDKHPWMKARRILPKGCRNHEHLSDEVWQSLVGVREKVNGDDHVANDVEAIQWLHLGDDIETMGGKFERALTSDLLGELVYDILSLDGSFYARRPRGEKRNNILVCVDGADLACQQVSPSQSAAFSLFSSSV